MVFIPDPFSVATLPRVVSGCNDILIDERGKRYIDLFSGHGAAFVGHANPRVAAAVAEQLQRVWVTGGLATKALAEAKEAVESFFPATHHLAGLYSTGMEAAEFALRLARAATGKPGVIGFAGSMHGKSLGTALLGWENTGAPDVPFIRRLPFGGARSDEQVLAQVEGTLSREAISAVFVEPIQASSGGHAAPAEFYRALQRLCRSHRSLLVFDEILTGFYRTGTAFVFEGLGLDGPPDVVLVGKAMGGGFPVSGVVARRDVPIGATALPGSTFANNALAAAAAAATLAQMREMKLPESVARIGRVIAETLRDLPEEVNFRGRGALWVIEVATAARAIEVVRACYDRGVFVSCASRFIRVLPAATIDAANLAEGCRVLREELVR